MSSSEARPAGSAAPDAGTQAGHVQSAGHKPKALMVEDDMNSRVNAAQLMGAIGHWLPAR
jgi:hypothetical protein